VQGFKVENLYLSMRAAFLLAFIVLTCQLRAQITKPSLVRENYSSDTIQKQLTRAQRMIISGAVLIPASLGIGVGGYYIGIAGTGRYIKPGILGLGVSMMLCSPFILVSGVVTLPLGIHKRNRWRDIKDEMHLSGGILPDGHAGFALSF
jgi:hypothetical protein